MASGASLGGTEDGEAEAQAAVLRGSHASKTEQGLGSSLAASQVAVGNRTTTNDAHVDGFAAANEAIAPGRRKRKSPDGSAEHDESGVAGSQPVRGLKKIRLAEAHAQPGAQSTSTLGSSLSLDKSLLPREIWHHIFTFCPPKSLGNLLIVNRLFNLYLDPASPFRGGDAPSGTPTPGAVVPMAPNAIWQVSRRLFWPQMPAPLRSKTELEMWQLACSPRCKECGRRHTRSWASSFDPHHPGPGTEGVRVIWAFGHRLCAACLLKTSDKELDVQISPSIPSAIIPALPFVFVTSDRHVFSATALEHGQLRPDVQVTKLFSKTDVEALQEEFTQVRDMGQGTVGEWLKGLPGRGSGLLHEASKWEKWESSGGVVRMRSLLYPGYERNVSVSLPRKPSTNPSTTPFPAQGRHERTAEEAAELKAARKAEIERRALLLEPPLTPEVLILLPAFQAATQIGARLDDDAWERLKPRLLAQRAEAEKVPQSERDVKSSVKPELRNQQQLKTTLTVEKEARGRLDKDWEEVQAPLRAKIAGYADEVVRDGWEKGKKVTIENCSRFAVDSLLYVRERFYAEVAKDAAAARVARKAVPIDPPEGPYTQKLTLENMKWIFDTKIKPHTEPLRKELFYCSGCEGNFKPFGFEGVIQHYAAKHTSAFSLGSIVVHWRAEWPEQPPFSATARPAKAPFNPHAPSGFHANGGAPLASNCSYPPPAGPVPPPLPPTYPPPMGSGYTPLTYSDHYQQPLPLPLLHPYQPQLGALPFAPQTVYEHRPSYATPPAPFPAYRPPTMAYPAPAADVAPTFVPPPGVRNDYPHGPYPANNAGVPFGPSQPPTYPDLYRTKVEDIARNSREIWRVLGDIRDLPGCVRVFTTIHHMVKRFRSRFYETPPLSMFIDGLSNNKEMRPVRNVNGLVCKACRLGLGNAASVEQGRKDFSLPQLATHFQSKHIERMQRTQPAQTSLDWVVDMVLVPDLVLLPSLASSANELQKALLLAAFPAAFTAPPTEQPYTIHRVHQYEQGPAERIYHKAANAREGPQTSVCHAGHSGPSEFGFRTDSRAASQSPQSATPGLPSENDRQAHSDKVRHSPQSAQPHRMQNGFHGKNEAGRNRGGKPQGAEGTTRSGKQFKADDGRKPEETSGSAMLAPSQPRTPSMRPSLTRPERHETAVVTQGRASELPSIQVPHQIGKDSMAPFANGGQEPNIMAALESYPDQRHFPDSGDQQSAQDAAAHTVTRDSTVFGSGSHTYSRPGDREGRAWSPPIPASRGRRSPGERHVEPVYHSRPEVVARREDMDWPQWAHAGFIDPLSQREEDERFGRGWPGDRGHRSTVPPPREATDRRYYHGDDMWMPQPRQAPVEAYEIVHVIDESGEYYIRRPVRRHEPDPARYRYEDRRIRHDAGPNSSALDSVYAPVSRSGLNHDGFRDGVGQDGWPAGRRANPAYYEEYDPRFPAA
ncbi:hypothetical protein N657DRAFT_10439 [Parathielavia appendiculata]|uniref:DUF7892 domain-containing protein n=1 Tax=Parathielavia appendiculata TaxID=2587402 RepID=A0AAN6Z8J7_9PEZI|nr:hypothetical protein N657DRAFT_10439 [Parathielavia appendiculata]